MKQEARKNARKYAMQAIYSWELSKNSTIEIIKQYKKIFYKKNIDLTYFNELITNIIIHYKILDELIQNNLEQKFSRLGQIEKAILRIAFYELLNRFDIPYKVSINEGIELAKIFGSRDSHKFINSILDKGAKNIRVNKIKKF
ncbi:transcription antitermination factor NusB [Buchnera aphidicola]|uniref:transcription antitermination factor NusB n=1 Tax=Buchnera aphidicola TaxID=9 RepID=UPI003463C384